MASATRRILLIVLLSVAAPAFAEEPRLVEYLEPDSDSGTSAAVLVGPCALAHTSQMLPIDADGKLVGKDDALRQTEQALANVMRALRAVKCGAEHIVRVHICVARPEVIAACRQQIRKQLPQSVHPAFTWTVGELPLTGALVAIDAVAAVPEHGEPRDAHRHIPGLPGPKMRSHVSILPRGRAVYVSGQAAPGGTLAEATRNTLGDLLKTLEYLDLDRSHIVQVKSFVQPMSNVEQVERELAAFFDGAPIPSTVHVEWTMSAPIEIELIASAPAGTARQAKGPISFLTPPGMQRSPVFSRVVVTDSNRFLYTSGVTSPVSDSAEREVRRVLDRLGELLESGGSDFRHLAKATYYVADDEVSRALNTVRPDYYAPERPPAASKAGVRGVGLPGERISIDFIAVPAADSRARTSPKR
jgi:enamine deaminase RidA (YjgF/YER057c/UK114 family)